MKAKDEQIKDLISKIGTASPSPSAVFSPSSSPAASVASNAANTEFDF
jgi:hypothetical protein